MSGFISALIKQRKDAKKAEPNTNARLKEILDILKKYDFDDGITPEIIVNILEDLGPTFVKIGQIASQQAEYIPPEYCDALVKLRSEVAPMEIEAVHSQIEKYLGKPTSELFASFDEHALGSASIGQVHKAVLFDGTVVAVKVRRPGVVDTVTRDFALIEKILDRFFKDGIGGMDIKGFILELEKTSKIELDFTNEANNLERFGENNAGREGIVVPKCYRELTCEAVLTEDFVTGNAAGDTAFIESLDMDERERIASLIADNFASQVLTDGLYHADPHSGNVFIREHVSSRTPVAESEETAQSEVDGDTASEEAQSEADGDTPSEEAQSEADGDTPSEQAKQLPEHDIEWIDFGMMGSLTSKQRQLLIDIVTAVVMQDAYGLKRAVLQVAKPVDEIDHGAMLEMCEDMCGQYSGADFGDFDLGDLLGTILGSLQDENYKVEPFLTNLSRGIIAMEGTLKTICPTVNILNFFTDKVNTNSILNFDLNLENPEEMNPEIAMLLYQFVKSTTDSSTKTAQTLDMLEKGQIKVRTDLGFEDKALASINRLTGYAIRSLLVIALFIGSCLLCTVPATTSNGTGLTAAFPVMGVCGYAIGIILAILIYRDMKKGK